MGVACRVCCHLKVEAPLITLSFSLDCSLDLNLGLGWEPGRF